MNEKDIICGGGLFFAKDTKRFLFLLRNHGKTAGTWGIVGGKKEETDTTVYSALQREIQEEIGFLPKVKKAVPLELFTSEDQRFFFNTYVLIVDKEFIPVLNDEHVGYAWCNLHQWPKPLHQGVKRSLSNKTNKTKIELLIDIVV